MFLIGQYDSPFVRRVAIAMRLYGIKFEHKPWSTFGDAEKIAPYNPLRRVPTLVLDSGEALLLRRTHRPFRHRDGLRAALHDGGTSASL
jgi:glutathione S-transferase